MRDPVSHGDSAGHGSGGARRRAGVLVAPDKFKGTLGAQAVAEAVGRGLREGGVDRVELLPVADGGEGTLDVLVAALGGRLVTARVTDPLGRPVEAAYAILDDGRAIVEMARASGLALVASGERDAEAATSRGTGELIVAALAAGAREIVVAAGGSATTDGGRGALEALGARFTGDTAVHEPSADTAPPTAADAAPPTAADAAPPTAAGTAPPTAADLDPVRRRLEGVRLIVACDVTSPMCGPHGAAPAFAPQKGADAAAVARLERRLGAWAGLARRTTGRDPSNEPMAGAAGGLAGGLWAFAGAELRPGAALVLDAIGFDDRARDAALVVTGEGRLDRQTLAGKAVAEVARRCARVGVRCAALVGSDQLGPEAASRLGLEVVPAVSTGIATPSDLERTARLLAERLDA